MMVAITGLEGFDQKLMGLGYNAFLPLFVEHGLQSLYLFRLLVKFQFGGVQFLTQQLGHLCRKAQTSAHPARNLVCPFGRISNVRGHSLDPYEFQISPCKGENIAGAQFGDKIFLDTANIPSFLIAN